MAGHLSVRDFYSLGYISVSNVQLRLATLQALIHDNDASLSTIGGKVDSIIAEDHVSPLVCDLHYFLYYISAKI